MVRQQQIGTLFASGLPSIFADEHACRPEREEGEAITNSDVPSGSTEATSEARKLIGLRESAPCLASLRSRLVSAPG